MEIITHIAVLVFAVIVIVGVGAFVVIDVFGRVDYLKDKAPWLEKALERRGALGVLLVAAIFLVIGDGYELINKEVPAVPAAPTIEIKGPRAPDISKCEIVRVVEAGTQKLGPQMNAPEKVCPPPTVVYQPAPGSPPLSQLDKLILANKNLAKGDRDRLADILFDFSKTLDQASALGRKAFNEGSELNKAWSEGTIVKSLDAHKTKLRNIDSEAKDFYKTLQQAHERGKYFQDQTSYVFGDNPYNLGPGALENAAESYVVFIERWATIQNKDQPIMLLFAGQQEEYSRYANTFNIWWQGCQTRLDQMRKSLQ